MSRRTAFVSVRTNERQRVSGQQVRRLQVWWPMERTARLRGPWNAMNGRLQ